MKNRRLREGGPPTSPGWHRSARRVGHASLVLACALPLSALATEGGSGHVLPGAVATLIDLAPTKPGWVAGAFYLNYDGSSSASREIPIAGLVAAGINARSNAAMLGGLHTFETKVLGAYYTAGAFLPYVWMDVEANVDTVLGTVRRKDSASGIGDVSLIPVMLAWKADAWQYNAALTIYAPSGQYEQGRLANPGLNYWTFGPSVGVSYNNEKNGFNAALYAGIGLTTENDATGYKSGSMLHFDGSVQQLLPAGPGFLGIGAEAFTSSRSRATVEGMADSADSRGARWASVRP